MARPGVLGGPGRLARPLSRPSRLRPVLLSLQSERLTALHCAPGPLLPPGVQFPVDLLARLRREVQDPDDVSGAAFFGCSVQRTCGARHVAPPRGNACCLQAGAMEDPAECVRA